MTLSLATGARRIVLARTKSTAYAWVAAAAAWSCVPAAFAEGDAAPGRAGSSSLAQWTRTEPIGSVPPRTSATAPLSDQANREGWVFAPERSDEFDGERLDPRLWTPRHRSWRGRQPARFAEENVEVAGGSLRLWMRKNGPPPEGPGQQYHTYTSAAVQANQRSLYGYYEVRAKPMDSAGSSSFWFAGNSDEWRTEIDVFELGGRAAGHEHRFNMNVHVFYRPGDQEHRNWGDSWETPFRLADDFHTYGLAWTPERITYYVDGSAVRWVENAYWRQPIYMIFDSETMIDWLGTPADEDLPSVYEVDYVRVWRVPPSGARVGQVPAHEPAAR